MVLTCTSLRISSRMTFSWAHNGKIIKTELPVNGNTYRSSSLTISNVRYSDGGSYVHIVRSGSLSVTSNTATITVYGKINHILYIRRYIIIFVLL